MKKYVTAIPTLLLLLGAAMAATSWWVESHTVTANDTFEGKVKNGVVNYGIDTTGRDRWYGVEITKISKIASWNGKGHAEGWTWYTCPGVAGEAKFGTAIAHNFAKSKGKNSGGFYKENVKTNFAEMHKGGNNFGWGYGTEMSAGGKYYKIGSSLIETTLGSNNGYVYTMKGAGAGTIKYGSAVYRAGANWGDGHGSFHLSRWEYNSASATGVGVFKEELHGEDFLHNFKYKLPGGGIVKSEVTFYNGMDPTKIWVYGH